jgi:undecaprenyl-diphosphatase
VWQAVAIIPGISRSGSTITGGLLRGLSRDAAARFSFLLGLPAIAGAAIIELPDLTGVEPVTVIAATAVSAATGFMSIAFLLRYLRTRTMRPFAAYCVVASAVALAVWFGGT